MEHDDRSHDDEAVKIVARARFIACFGCLVVIAFADGPAAQSPRATGSVLLLQQSDTGGAPLTRFDAAFIDALHSATSGSIELYAENIDSERFPGAAQARVFTDYLAKKYAGRKMDVIVAQGMRGLTFARQHRALFGNPPIVTTVAPAGVLNHKDNIIGLQGGFWIEGTLALATQLLPDTRAVYVIDGVRNGTGDMEAEVRRQWKANAQYRNLTLVYLRNLELSDVVSRVAAVPPHSIVLLVRQTMRTQSQDVDRFESLAQVLRASPVPVFTQIEDFIGHGVVGGYVWRFGTDARRMADMATLIASGTSPHDIQFGRNSYDTMLDWQQLRRWGIAESRIPSGSIVLSRPKSFFEVYGGYVAAGAAVFTAQFTLIVGLLAQRSRRRRAEEDARTHASRYRSVVDAQSELICRFLPDTTLTFVNDSYCRFWNRSREELLGHQFIELIPPAARASVVDRLQHLQGVDSHEHPVCLPDGTEGWHHWVNSAIVDQHGRVIEIQGVGRDITDKKRAEHALRTAEVRNTAILRAIPDLMFVLRRDGTYVDYHARDPSMLFTTPDKFLGRTVREILPPELADTLMDALDRTCATGEPVVVEYELAGSEVRYYEARLVPAANDQVLSIVRDVTDTRRARELNRALAGRLIVSQEEERQRIARELHDDLSQKIAVLNIDVDRLTHQLQQSEHRTWLRKISTQVNDIAGHLHDLSYELHPARLQTLGLLESLQVLCSEFSHQRDVKVAFAAADSELPTGVDSAVSLCVYRITQEALHNVARHSRASDASVQLSYDSGDICLQIADSGVGFEPHSSRHTGLGLVSMRERVGILNGKLVIYTAPGRGTRIAARIPLPTPQHHADSVSRPA
jgi:PAS domain S-box-containing protein